MRCYFITLFVRASFLRLPQYSLSRGPPVSSLRSLCSVSSNHTKAACPLQKFKRLWPNQGGTPVAVPKFKRRRERKQVPRGGYAFLSLILDGIDLHPLLDALGPPRPHWPPRLPR